MIRVGLMGLDNVHAFRFTDLFNIDIPERVQGAKVVAAWDNGPSFTEKYASEFPNVKMVDELDELKELIDLLIIMRDIVREDFFLDTRKNACNFLESGIAVFVDKPFADTLNDAQHIIDSAKANGAPLICTSCIRYAPQILRVKERVKGLGKMSGATGRGVGDMANYGVHTIEPLHALLGPGVDSVYSVSDEKRDAALLRWKDGRVATAQVIRDTIYMFQFSVFCEKGVEEALVASDRVVSGQIPWAATLRKAVEMARTRKPPIPYPEIMDVLRTLIGIQESVRQGKPVHLDDIGPRATLRRAGAAQAFTLRAGDRK